MSNFRKSPAKEIVERTVALARTCIEAFLKKKKAPIYIYIEASSIYSGIYAVG